MGLSSKKTKTTTTPTVAPWMGPNLTDYSGDIREFLDQDPTSFVAPASELQNQAFAGAQDLGGWKPYATQALDMAGAAGAQPASSVNAVGYNAPQLGPASQTTAARLGAAPSMQSATLGPASQTAAAQLGPASLAGGVTLDPTQNATAFNAQGRSILDDGGVQRFMDPGLDAFVNNSLASYDQDSGQRRAAMAARAGGSGAFGGSRYGLAEGQFEADTGMNRALTESGLRSQAYTQAMQAAGMDADRMQQANIFNAGNQTNVSGLNAGAANQRSLAQGGLDWNRISANQNAQNQFGLAQGQFDQSANMFNADAANQFASQQAGYNQQAGLANQAMQGQYGLQQGAYDQQAGLANQAATNQYGLAQAGLTADASQYGATAQNTANLTNAQLQEQAYQRQMQAAGLTADIGSAYGANDRADLGLTADLGQMQRGIASEYTNAYPTQLQMAGQLYRNIAPEAYIGNIGTSKTSGLGTVLPSLIGGVAQGIASGGIKFSDRRLKTDIQRIGSRGPLGLYSFTMGGKRQTGVMADEVAIHAPHALGPVVGGYSTVDYGKLGLAYLVEG